MTRSKFAIWTLGVSAVALMSSQAVAQDAGQSRPDDDEVDEIVVTGSRIARAGYAAPTPVTVVGEELLETRAPAAVAEALYELPIFTNAGPTQANRGSTAVGFNILNLRSLGPVRTLVLVDGRRFVPTNTSTTFDSNLIPTGLVARTEIVTGGASAAYGSDAVAGVVNIILNDDLDGLKGTLQFGRSQEGDNEETVVSLAGGRRFLDGRLRVIAGADYSSNDGIGYPGVGFYARDWGRNEYGRMTLPATRAAGLPANFIGENIEYANKTPGGIIASGPLRGTAFGPGGTPFAFQYGSIVGTDQMQGTSNYGFSVTGRQPLRSPNERFVSLARANFEVNDSLTLFAEVNYGKQEGTSNTAQATQDNNIIGLNNAFLPAATRAAMVTAGVTTINVGRLVEENGPYRTHNTNTTLRGVVGARGTIFNDWKFDLFYEHGENDYTLDVANVIDVPNFLAAIHAVRDPITNNIVCGTNATNPNAAAGGQLNPGRQALVQPGCVPFNIFGQGSPSAESLDYVTNQMFNDITATQDSGAINLSGEPFSTWAGPVSTAFGYEYRRNEAVGTGDARSAVNANFYGNYKPINGEITVHEGYLEFIVPLAREMAWAKMLDFNGAVRYTDYSTSGGVTTWKAGLTYEPVDMLRLRGTRSRDIRAPNIGEIFTQGGGGVFTGTINPLTGASGQIPTINRGNPALTPEIADTTTAGIVFQPTWGWAQGFRASVDYYSVEIADVIATPQTVDTINGCIRDNNAAFCSALTRDPTTGNATSIILQPLNLNQLSIDGFDFEMDYRFPFEGWNIPGDLSLRVLASWTNDLETIGANGVSLGDKVGTNYLNGEGVPEWVVTTNLTYALDRFTAALQVRGFTSVKYGTQFIGPDDPAYSPTLGNSINKNVYPGLAYANLSLRYELDPDGRYQVFANVDNLFDKDPPFGWLQDIGTYDTIGRTFKAGIRFEF